MDKEPRSKSPLMLVISEEVLSRIVARENLLGEDRTEGDIAAELDRTIDMAVSEIAQALVETGRPLRHLHLLRVSLDANASRRGYEEGARTTGWICNSLARDLNADAEQLPTQR